jgi:hypothetical protein
MGKSIEPRVYERLLENSISAALSSIEIYNKPDFKYRDEIFTILATNAWELLLKAKLLKDAGDNVATLFVISDGKPKLNRNGQPLTIEILGAMRRVGLDAVASANIETLVEIRDTAVHFYNSAALSYVIYTLGVACLRNYQELVKQWFARSLLEYNFYILPLAFVYQFRTLSLIDCDKEPEAVASLIRSVADRQSSLPSSSEFHLVCEVAAQIVSAKKLVEGSSDIVVSVKADSAADAVFVIKLQRLTDKYPLSYSEVYQKVRAKIPGAKQSQIDHAIKHLAIKGNPKFSAYNFRTKLHEENFKKTSVLPKSIPSIYNEDAVLLLTETLRSNSAKAG